MKKEWFRRGGLIDYERLDTRAKILLILAFAILQRVVLLPVGAFLSFLFVTIVLSLVPGINPLTFMLLTHEAKVIVVNVFAGFFVFSTFCGGSLPIAYLMRIPVVIILLFAVLYVPGLILTLWAFDKIF